METEHLQLTVFSPEIVLHFLDACPNITEKGQEFSNLLYLLEVGSQTVAAVLKTCRSIATVGKCMRGVYGKDLNITSMLKNLRKEALKFKAILGYVARRCLQTPKAERLQLMEHWPSRHQAPGLVSNSTTK